MSGTRVHIEVAYRRALTKANDGWELRPNSKTRLMTALDRLTLIAAQIKNPPKPAPRVEQFRQVGRESARRELDKLAEAAERVIRCVDALHQPAILALADRGIMRGHVIRGARSLAAEARAADISRVPTVAGRGRPKNNLSIVVAATVVRDFERLTGARADLPADAPAEDVRGLTSLVADVFKGMGIKANAKAAIKAALAERNKNTLGKSN